MRQKDATRMDNRKLIVAFYILCSMVAWFLTRSGLAWLFVSFYQVRRLPGIPQAREGLPIAIGATLFIVLLRHPKVNLVLEEVVSELKKVTWPTRDDVVRSTTVVMICIIIASFILAGFDLVFGKLITLFLKA